MKNFLRRLRGSSLCQLSSLDAYALWADQYRPQPHNALMQLEQETMLSLLPDLYGKSVLDLACGTGRYSHIALEAGAALVVGTDNSEAMLHESSLQNRVLAPMHQIPLQSNGFDIVICGLAIGHYHDLSIIMREMGRVLKTGGVALISDFHPAQVAAGAQRTFQAPDGKTYAVEHYPHWYAAHYTAAQAAGLNLQAIEEPTLNGNLPVILVLRYMKP